jgi:integrase/recombinase XerD
MQKKIKKREIQISVLEAASDYLSSPHVKGLSSRTQEEYSQELDFFTRWCASHEIVQLSPGKPRESVTSFLGIMLHQIDQHTVRLFLDDLKATHPPCKGKELSTYTIAGYARVIKSFLYWCLKDDQYAQYVSETIINRIEKPKIIETIIEVFTTEQIKALFKACDKEESEHLQLRDRAILAVLLDCGLRATELCTLTIGNVSLDAKDAYVRVLGKGNKWGEVGLGDQSLKYVRKYIRMFREPTVEHAKENRNQAFVFVNRHGEQLTKSGLWRIFDRLGHWAHIEGVRCSPHTMRHTFAQMFIRNGGDIYTLSKLMRHSSLSVTEQYLKSLQQSESRKGAKSVLDNL